MRGLGATLFALLLALPVGAVLIDAYRTDADFLTAQRAVATAEDALAKVKADPEATPMSLARAQDELATVSAALSLAETIAKQRIHLTLTDVLVAQLRQQVSRAKAADAHLQLQATELKLQAGAIAPHERNRVRDAAARADAAADEESRALAGALTRLKTYGALPEESLADPPAAPLAGLHVLHHPKVAQAQQQANEARRTLNLSKGPDTAPLDLAAAQRAYDNAADTLRDVMRLQTEVLDAAIRRYQSAREQLQLARDGYALDAVSLETARKRFAAGAISRLALSAAESAEFDGQLRCMTALAEYWSAFYSLRQATGDAS